MSITTTPDIDKPFPIVIVSSFTSEPIEDTLCFWMHELEINSQLKFAPYNQIFQQLLDPDSLLRQNKGGINILLLRFEDWLRDETEPNSEKLNKLYSELCSGINTACETIKSPLLVYVCPDSPNTQEIPELNRLFEEFRNRLTADLESLPHCYLITPAEANRYPIKVHYDALRDELGHIPYTASAFASFSTILSRKIYAINSTPSKVIVLDCDNTLWGGVIGEDGVNGIDLSADWQYLQKFMQAQKDAGILLCLCSKNNEVDVMEVFEKRSDMHLQLSDIVSWRINWLPKSENIRSLADELNLGLDSFIFIDDNPVECEEVRANIPEILTINLPKQHIPEFLNHIWSFDRIKTTTEDKLRTTLYQQDIARKNLEKSFNNYQDFLDGLELKVNIAEPLTEQIARVAQLTQRTNQFNNTTIRRSEIDIQRLAESNLQVRMIEVKDRYGDYGLVGVIIFAVETDTLKVESFMLSCRVLGRGVENHILKYLAKIAQQSKLATINIPYIATAKNTPFLNFLEHIIPEGAQFDNDILHYKISTDRASEMHSIIRSDLSTASTSLDSSKIRKQNPSVKNTPLPLRLISITTQLTDAEQILAWVEKHRIKHSRNISAVIAPPQTRTEKQLVEIWQGLLGIDNVGIADDYFDLGGTSLQAVELIIEIKKKFGVTLPLSAILEYPTIQSLAEHIIPETAATDAQAPIPLNNSHGRQAIFFIHDGDGEVLLYRNLALQLEKEFRIYGLKPHGTGNFPMLDTSIPEMAERYIEQIYLLQTQGPFLLAGMCAGGVIAFEVAKQLCSSGRNVGFIGLLDAADVAATKRAGKIANERLNRLNASLGNEKSLELMTRALNLAQIILKKIFNLLRYELTSKSHKFIDTLKVMLLRQYLLRKWPIPEFLANIPVRSVYLFAEAHYQPDAVLECELVLFRATSGTQDDEPYINIYADELFGWGKRSSVGVKTYDIPGGHASMLQEPNVKHMAECICEYINIKLNH